MALTRRGFLATGVTGVSLAVGLEGVRADDHGFGEWGLYETADRDAMALPLEALPADEDWERNRLEAAADPDAAEIDADEDEDEAFEPDPGPDAAEQFTPGQDPDRGPLTYEYLGDDGQYLLITHDVLPDMVAAQRVLETIQREVLADAEVVDLADAAVVGEAEGVGIAVVRHSNALAIVLAARVFGLQAAAEPQLARETADRLYEHWTETVLEDATEDAADDRENETADTDE